MKKVIKITDGDLCNMVMESVRTYLEESLSQDDFFNEEDSNGNYGQPGQVKSYDIGYYSTANAEEDARQNGFDNLEDYLTFWWREVGPEVPFTWQTLGGGYGFHGDTIAQIGNVCIKAIYDQIMVDEYPPM